MLAQWMHLVIFKMEHQPNRMYSMTKHSKYTPGIDHIHMKQDHCVDSKAGIALQLLWRRDNNQFHLNSVRVHPVKAIRVPRMRPI